MRHIAWHRVEDENGDPYMLRAWIGRLRLHVFYRGDNDRDPHDHPWGFWTFPLISYVEVVQNVDGLCMDTKLVRAFRLHYRPATYTHMVLGKWSGTWIDASKLIPAVGTGKIITLVWRTGWRRDWGFLKTRDGRTCWQYWRDYIYEGGRNAPCGDDE